MSEFTDAEMKTMLGNFRPVDEPAGATILMTTCPMADAAANSGDATNNLYVLSAKLERENATLRDALMAVLKLCDDCGIFNETTKTAEGVLSNSDYPTEVR